MKKKHSLFHRWGLTFVVLLLPFVLGGCGYNRMITLDENISASWAQVQNQYQRRYDLIPNLVETVKGYAAQEQETLLGVTQARSQAGGMINLDTSLLDDPETFSRYQEAQSSLGGALQRLLMITENYPDLKSNQNFLALQDQLEGTENRLSVERKRFNEAVQIYNSYIRRFPRSIVANITGFETKSYLTATAGAETAPQVEF